MGVERSKNNVHAIDYDLQSAYHTTSQTASHASTDRHQAW